jgi:hypothetical protein
LTRTFTEAGVVITLAGPLCYSAIVLAQNHFASHASVSTEALTCACIDVTAAAAVAHSRALQQSAVVTEKARLTLAETVVLVAENMISRTVIRASDVKLRLEHL